MSRFAVSARNWLIVATLAFAPAIVRADSLRTIPSEMRDAANPIRVAIDVPQPDLLFQWAPEIFVRTAPSSGLIEGIIDRTIAASERKKEKRSTDPVIVSLSGFDYENQSKDAARSSFKDIGWIDFGDKVADGSIISDKSYYNAGILIFSFGILPQYNRMFVACELKIAGTRRMGEKSDRRWQADRLLYDGRGQSVVEFVGLPEDKTQRGVALASKNGSFLRSNLTFAIRDCARLLALGAPMTNSDALNIMARKKITVATRPNIGQYNAWAVSGEENVTASKFGYFGLKLGYTTPDTDGVLLYGGENYFFHQRTVTFTP